MKKLLTLIIAFVMCVCLVNLNSNVTKAELDENGEEIVETIPAEELDENGNPIETTPNEEVVAEAAEAFTEVTEGIVENDKGVAISNAKQLNDFFAAKQPLEGYLTKSFVYNVDPAFPDGDTTVCHDKTLDLNGHSLTLDNSLSFRLQNGWKNQVSINIVNSGKTSYLIATENTLLAMVQTKMTDDYQSQKTPAQLVFNIDGGKNGIVFDGSKHSKNLTDFVGLSLGYSNPLSSYEEQPLHNVSVTNVAFNNFYPNYKKYNTIGIGVLNSGANVQIVNSKFDNCTIGVASGVANEDLTHLPFTGIFDSKVQNCYTGIGNGLIMVLGEIELEVSPTNVEVKKSSIKNNKFGLSCLGNKDKLNGKIGVTNVVGSEVDNKVDFYCDRNQGFKLEKLDEDSRYVFAVPGKNKKDNAIWKGNIVAISSQRFTNPVLYSVDTDTDELYDKEYALQITNRNGLNEYAAIATDGEGIIMDSIVAAETGKKVSFRVTETNLDGGETNVNNIYLVGPDEKTYKFTSKYNSSGHYYVVTFTPSVSGEYYLVNYDSDNNTYLLSNRVNVIVYDYADPSKKDESCEKVIGPTWHWNNAKGICEETGVVNTYTR